MAVLVGAATVNTTQMYNNIVTDAGGGIRSAGTLTVTNTAFSGNRANYGSGIANRNTLTLINSTFSGNQTTHATDGGAIAQYQVGPVPSATILNSTIVSNTAASTSGGIWERDGTLNIGNSIVASNNVTNNVQVDGGTFTSLGYNLTNSGVSTPFTTTTDLANTNPLLGPLQNNGGPTMTHALLAHSPAIDAGDPSFNPYLFNPPLLSDQRGPGFPRVVKGRLDIGALESPPGHH
jgi:hypothetical protein